MHPTDTRRAAIAVYGAAARGMSEGVVHSRQRADQATLCSWNTFNAWIGLTTHPPNQRSYPHPPNVRTSRATCYTDRQRSDY